MIPSNLNDLPLEELLALLPQGGYSFRTTGGDWLHGVVEQTWDGDPHAIDREDVLIFLRRHHAFLEAGRNLGQDGDDCVVIQD